MAEKLRKRSEIADKYKWKLTDIYPTLEAWETAFAALGEKIAAFAQFDGKVAEDPRKVIRAYFELDEKMSPVFSYAFLRKETDNADPTAQAMSDRVRALAVQASTASAFMQPELLDLDESILNNMIIGKNK